MGLSSLYFNRPPCGSPVQFNVLIRVQLCDPMGCSPPGSSVHGASHAGILEWVATPSSRGSPDPGIEHVSPVTPALQADSLPLSHCGSPKYSVLLKCISEFVFFFFQKCFNCLLCNGWLTEFCHSENSDFPLMAQLIFQRGKACYFSTQSK